MELARTLNRLIIHVPDLFSYILRCGNSPPPGPKNISIFSLSQEIRLKIYHLALTNDRTEWLDLPLIYLVMNNWEGGLYWKNSDGTYLSLQLVNKAISREVRWCLSTSFAFACPTHGVMQRTLRTRVRHIAYPPSYYTRADDIERSMRVFIDNVGRFDTVRIFIPHTNWKHRNFLYPGDFRINHRKLMLMIRMFRSLPGVKVAVVGQVERIEDRWDDQVVELLVAAREPLESRENYLPLDLFYPVHGSGVIPPIPPVPPLPAGERERTERGCCAVQ